MFVVYRIELTTPPTPGRNSYRYLKISTPLGKFLRAMTMPVSYKLAPVLLEAGSVVHVTVGNTTKTGAVEYHQPMKLSSDVVKVGDTGYGFSILSRREFETVQEAEAYCSALRAGPEAPAEISEEEADAGVDAEPTAEAEETATTEPPAPTTTTEAPATTTTPAPTATTPPAPATTTTTPQKITT